MINYSNEKKMAMESTLDDFMISCENNMICYAEDLGLDLVLENDIASFINASEEEDLFIIMEGVNMDIASLVRDSELKAARDHLKMAKKLKRQKNFKDAHRHLDMAKALAKKMKDKVDKMPEPKSRGEKLMSYFTPLFTLMPRERLEDVKVIPRFSNGDLYFDFEFQYVRISDKMSDDTGSNVKKRLQQRFNLFIDNIEKYSKSYKEAERFYQTKMKKKEAKNLKAATV